jgi:hypothetical protein
VCCALPVWLVATNFREADRSRDVSEDVQLERLLEALSEPAALVKEDFLVDRLVTSKLLGDGRGRHIPLTSPHLATVRDRTPGTTRSKIFGFLSLGWTGSFRTWHRYEVVYLLLETLRSTMTVGIPSFAHCSRMELATSVVVAPIISPFTPRASKSSRSATCLAGESLASVVNSLMFP